MNKSKQRRSSVKVTDEVAEHLADDAEAGYSPSQVHVRPTGRGRPRLGRFENCARRLTEAPAGFRTECAALRDDGLRPGIV
jgi:hypothetical protein